MDLQPIYPARNPMFHAQCVDCGKVTDSANLYADSRASTYVCTRCVFTFRMLSIDTMRELERQRDSRELSFYKGMK